MLCPNPCGDLNVGPSQPPFGIFGSTKVGSGGWIWDGMGVGSWVLPPTPPILEGFSPAHHTSPTLGAASTSPAHWSVHWSIRLSIWIGAHYGPPKHAHFIVLLQDVRYPG